MKYQRITESCNYYDIDQTLSAYNNTSWKLVQIVPMPSNYVVRIVFEMETDY